MNIQTLRSRLPESCEHLTDEMLNEIISLTNWSIIWHDNDLDGYLRSWHVYESFTNFVEDEVGDEFFEQDFADQEEEARQMIINKGLIYFTTSDHEVVILDFP